jgi:hypothetical protein
MGKRTNAKDIHKEMFPVYGGKSFTTASRNSLKDVSKVADDARSCSRDENETETTGRVDSSG